MPFWPGLRSGKGAHPAGAGCAALASTPAPRRVPGSGVAGSAVDGCALCCRATKPMRRRDPRAWL